MEIPNTCPKNTCMDEDTNMRRHPNLRYADQAAFNLGVSGKFVVQDLAFFSAFAYCSRTLKSSVNVATSSMNLSKEALVISAPSGISVRSLMWESCEE